MQRLEMTRNPDQNHCFDGFVLVGGASSRMGRDKAQMSVGGAKLFERGANALSAICEQRVALIGRAGSEFDCALPLLCDIRTEGEVRAPIIGLYTALTYAATPWIAILACDLPFVTPDLMGRLGRLCTNEFDAVVPVQPDTRPQPLCAFYRREKCFPVVETMIRQGDLKMQTLLSPIRTRFVQFDEISDLDGSADFFLNVNHSDDYKTAQKKANEASS